MSRIQKIQSLFLSSSSFIVIMHVFGCLCVFLCMMNGLTSHGVSVYLCVFMCIYVYVYLCVYVYVYVCRSVDVLILVSGRRVWI